MNSPDHDLDRLLKAASQVKRPVEPPSFGWETRVLARALEGPVASLVDSSLALFKRALLLGCVLMTLSMVYYFEAPTPAPSTEDDVASSAIASNLP